MPNCKLVEMGECVVLPVNDKDSCLKTEGISTCIALIFKGTIDEIPYIGLYHWAGFCGDEADVLLINDLFEEIALEIQSEFSLQDKPPNLESLFVIGGERQQVEEDGTLLISGTANEVQLLKQHSENCCQVFFDVENLEITFLNFLTSNTQSLEINVYRDKLNYRYEQSNFLESRKLKAITEIEFRSTTTQEEDHHPSKATKL